MVENQNDIPYLQYFYIDYELYPEPLPEDTVYFHAHWRRALPNAGWGPDLQTNSIETTVAEPDGADNYVALETEGRGHYVGCTLAVRHFQGSWWGEGDDMIFIDDDTWPPSLHGTGMEDYFGHAWGMQHNAYLFNGTIVHEEDVPGFHHSYRFHLVDPIRFEKRIKVTFEHGHGNHLSDDWSSDRLLVPDPALARAERARRWRSGCRCDRSTASSRRRCPSSPRNSAAARAARPAADERFVDARDALRERARRPRSTTGKRGNVEQCPRRSGATYDAGRRN